MPKKRMTYKQQYQRELKKLQREISKPYYYGGFELRTKQTPKNVSRQQVENLKAYTKEIKKAGQRVKNIETKGYEFAVTPIELPKALTKQSIEKFKRETSSRELYRQARYYYYDSEVGNPYISGTQAHQMEREHAAKRGAQKAKETKLKNLIEKNEWLVKKTSREISDDLMFDESGNLVGFSYNQEEQIRQAKQQLFDKYKGWVERGTSVESIGKSLEEEREEHYYRLHRAREQVEKEVAQISPDEVQEYYDTAFDTDYIHPDIIAEAENEEFLRTHYIDPETGEYIPKGMSKQEFYRSNEFEAQQGAGEYPNQEDMSYRAISNLMNLLDSFDPDLVESKNPVTKANRYDIVESLKNDIEVMLETGDKSKIAQNIEDNWEDLQDTIEDIMYTTYRDGGGQGNTQYDPVPDYNKIWRILNE